MYKYEQNLKRGLSAINGPGTQYFCAHLHSHLCETAQPKLSGPQQIMTAPFSHHLHLPQFSCLQQNHPFQKQYYYIFYIFGFVRMLILIIR